MIKWATMWSCCSHLGVLGIDGQLQHAFKFDDVHSLPGPCPFKAYEPYSSTARVLNYVLRQMRLGMGKTELLQCFIYHYNGRKALYIICSGICQNNVNLKKNSWKWHCSANNILFVCLSKIAQIDFNPINDRNISANVSLKWLLKAPTSGQAVYTSSNSSAQN